MFVLCDSIEIERPTIKSQFRNERFRIKLVYLGDVY